MIPDRGDILHLAFDLASEREMRGDHYCLVVSPKPFNQRFGLAFVCPVSGGRAQVARDTGFLVSLMGTGLRTTGNVHAHQIKALDWAARRAVLVEHAPPEIVALVLDCLIGVLEE